MTSHPARAPDRRGGRADEQAAARRLARALREASAGGRAETVIASAAPPGRLRMRHAVTTDAQRAAGAVPTAKPFTRVERRRVPAPPLAVGSPAPCQRRPVPGGCLGCG